MTQVQKWVNAVNKVIELKVEETKVSEADKPIEEMYRIWKAMDAQLDTLNKIIASEKRENRLKLTKEMAAIYAIDPNKDIIN